MRRFSIVLIAMVTVAAALGCGFSSEESRADELRAAAKSLIPAKSTLIGEELGACIEFADEPSCVVLLFAVEDLPPQEMRVRLGEAVAEANGWHLTDTTSGSGGTILEFEKDGFEASLVFWRETSGSCDGETPRDCGDNVDHVWLTYAGGKSLL